MRKKNYLFYILNFVYTHPAAHDLLKFFIELNREIIKVNLIGTLKKQLEKLIEHKTFLQALPEFKLTLILFVAMIAITKNSNLNDFDFDFAMLSLLKNGFKKGGTSLLKKNVFPNLIEKKMVFPYKFFKNDFILEKPIYPFLLLGKEKNFFEGEKSLLLLPLPPTEFVHLSGLFSFPKSLLILLNKDPLLKEDFLKLMLLIDCKINYYFFSDLHINESFIKKIENSFLIPWEYKQISSFKENDEFLRHNWTSIIQHFIIKKFLGKNILSIKELEEYYPGIAFDLYSQNRISHTNISLAVEMVIGNFAYNYQNKDFSLKNKVSLLAVNKDNPFLVNKGSLYNESKSLLQIKQPFCDLLVLRLLFSPYGIIIEDNYRDIKGYFKNSLSGHLTGKPYLNSQVEVNNMNINNIVSMLKAGIKNNKNQNVKNKLESILSDIQDIKENKLTLKEKNDQIIKILLTKGFDKELTDNGIHFTVVGDTGPIDNEIKPIITNIDRKTIYDLAMKNGITLEDFFPNSGKIDIKKEEKLNKFLLELTKSLIPDKFKEHSLNTINNMEKALIIFKP